MRVFLSCQRLRLFSSLRVLMKLGVQTFSRVNLFSFVILLFSAVVAVADVGDLMRFVLDFLVWGFWVSGSVATVVSQDVGAVVA